MAVFSEDEAGDRDAVQTFEVKLDDGPPKVCVDFNGSRCSWGATWYNSPVEVKVQAIDRSAGVLNVISVEDCIRDRLAAFFFWDDFQSLEQSCLVASDNTIELTSIEMWAN